MTRFSISDEPTILRAARSMIANHGARAAQIAEDRAARVQSDGANGAAMTWRRVASAILTLESE